VRIFLSFNSRDTALAEAVRSGLSRIEPGAQIFFSSVSLGAGFWLPKLADEIAQTEAFLLLIGPNGVGPWQEVEYFTAFDRHVNDKYFTLVPAIVGGAAAPGLSFLRSLNWVEAPVLTDDKVLHRLLAALKGETVASATPLWKLVNPYHGLEAMNEANADYFYGRTRETAALLNALASNSDRWPILIGASGVGKSSVAQAGVLSALKSMRWPETDGDMTTAWPRGLQNSRGWVSLIIRPGEAPLEALTAAMIRLWRLDTKDPKQAALPRQWAQGLSAGHNTLSDLIGSTQEQLKKREGEAPERVLLYIDNCEELYIHTAQSDANRFSEVLAEGLGDRRLLAFASLRADYFDRLQADKPLFNCHEHVNVPPLDRAQLHEVVTGPARALGVEFEDVEVANRITAAASAQPGALPLLSYLLTDMWAAMVKRGDATLRLPAQSIDVGGVLASRAEEFVKANPDEEKALRRLHTLRLTALPPEGEPVRRQTTRAECTDAEWALAGRLADHPWRLVVMSEREVDGRIVAEVAHEALLRAWPRLVDWLRDEREFLIFKGDAERAERRWRERGQIDKALLSGLDLARAEEWFPSRSEDLSPEVVSFVQRSITAERAAKSRQVRLERGVINGAVAAGLLIIMIAGVAVLLWVDRGHQRDRATEKNALTLKYVADLAGLERTSGDVGTAILLALDALPDGMPFIAEAEEQLALAWQALRERFVLKGHLNDVWSAAFNSDGRRIVTSSSDRTARLWDAETGKPIGEPLQGHDNIVLSTAFSPDGKRIVTASEDHTARLWDVESGRPIGEPLKGHQSAVWSAGFSPDGRRIVTASSDRTVRLWDAETGKPIGVPFKAHDNSLLRAAFSPDSKRIVTASEDHTARMWDAETGKPLGEPFRGHKNSVLTAAFSPDGKRIVTASEDQTVRLWDVETGKPIGEPLRGHENSVSTAAFSPDGKRIVTASEDQTARLWDVETGKPIAEPMKGHDKSVSSAAFSPDGKRIVTASEDHTARLWDTESGEPIGDPLQGHENSVWSAAFSPDGRRIVTASSDRTVRLWDAETGQPIGEPLRGHESSVSTAAFSPDGRRIVTASEDWTVRAWDAQTGQPIGEPLKGHENSVWSAAFSPDGRLIVTASSDWTVRVWDAETGKPIGDPFKAYDNSVLKATFNPDGKRVVTVSQDHTARLWDVESGKSIGEPLKGHTNSVLSAAFSPDGKRIVTASEDQTAQLWDVESGKPIGQPLKGHANIVLSAAFSPDGKRIVTASEDHTVRVWDAETGKPIGEPLKGHDKSVSSAVFSPDGRHIVTASKDQTARVWDVEITKRKETFADLMSQAKAASPRCLTTAQRRTFRLSPELPPDWCIDLEKWPYHTSQWKRWLSEIRAGKNPPPPSSP
jgi:WD40 repeat protein